MLPASRPVGTLQTLARYPVKSMQGQVLTTAYINERGILGDRAYAIQENETGFVASGKHPRKWGRLLQCSAAFLNEPRPGESLPPLAITLPNGQRLSTEQPDCNAQLSNFLGRDVQLISAAPLEAQREADRSVPEEDAYQSPLKQETFAYAAPAGTFFDYSAIHILTTATLQQLQCLYPSGQFDFRRFRPNLLIEPMPEAQGFVENAWLGQGLTGNDSVRLNLIDPSPRCIVTTLPQNGLTEDRAILRTIAQHNSVAGVTLAPGHIFRAVAGVYATVSNSGFISVGDKVWLSESVE